MATRLGNRGLLLLAALLTLVLWQIPWGFWVLYPFTLLATYAHEMGHGLSALLIGADFQSLNMFPDGSGYARWAGDVGRLGKAFIAAGGLVGPSIAGSTILILSKRTSRARWLLWAVGGLMFLSVAFFARNGFSILFVSLMAGSLVLSARLSPHRWSPFLIQLLGVQLCLAVFRDVGYMFSEGGMVGGQLRPSDSAQIAEALLLPYWFWGGLTAAISFAVLALGLYIALGGSERAPKTR